MPKVYKLFIDGHWVDSTTKQTLNSIDPATEEIIATVPRGNAEDINQAVQAARLAFENTWSQYKPKERAHTLYQISQAIKSKADKLAHLETLDSGKPIPLSKKEILSTARYFEYYAGAADKLHGESIPLGPDYVDFTIREPMGVTAHIVPWNMPFNMLGRSVAPALAAGNTIVLKPAEQTPLTALMMAEILQDIAFPAGVYNVVTGLGEEAGAALSHHPDIDSITFTGSVETGRAIMKAAATHIKPVVLELGGKSPNIIFADADLDLAVEQAAKGIYTNCGQVCSAGSRLLIHSKIKDTFLEKLIARSQQIRIGPGVESPDMGPLISQEQYERVLSYINIGQTQGADILIGGGRPEYLKRGYFVAPTLLNNVQPDMRVAQEEIFGPVLSIFTFEDDDQAIEIANSVSYGLVAGIFTTNINRALRLATRIRAGQIYINEYFPPGEETPFGGYKQSGFGREKGLAALENYTQIKNIAIRIY